MFLNDPETLNVLFYAANLFIEKLAQVQGNQEQMSKIKSMAFVTLKCLNELANVRLTIFEDKEQKNQYAANIAKNIIESFGSMN